jgi:putative ABC transport system permease protein
MSVFESIRVALDMLRLHKMRSFLTMLGVIIGVMSVSLIVILVNGFSGFINNQFKSLSADGIYVIYDPTRLRDGDSSGQLEGVDEDVKRYIMDRVPQVNTVSGLLEAGNHTVKFEGREVEGVKVLATDVNNHILMKKDVITGRLISQDDVDRLQNSAVISESLAEKVFGKRNSPTALTFGGKDPVGQTILLPGLTLEVVGVMKRPPQIGGPPSDDVIEIASTTAQRKWIGGRTYTYLMAQAKPGVPLDEAMDELWKQLMVLSNNRPIFRVDSNQSILNIFGTIIGSIGVVLAGVAAMSLLVGGIGIMNIMLVSVKERTREIGLRKAVGAQKGTILLQFLVEAAVLSLVGGMIGMGVAWVLGLLVSVISVQAKFPNENGLQASFPFVWAGIAMAFSALIGIVFGLFPAYSAAKLDPIVALRYE